MFRPVTAVSWASFCVLLLAGIGPGAGCLSGVARAAVPSVDHFLPAAGQLGTTNLVAVVGKIDPWPARVWTDDPGLVFRATTNRGEFSVEVSAGARLGPHFVRVHNEEGSSRPRCFVVDSMRQRREVEPNDERGAAPDSGALPVVWNGRLDKSGDVDSFGVSLVAGQTLVIEVEAYVLESPLDAVVRVLDPGGVQVAWNHDGRTLDPFLAFTAAASGRHVVQVFGFPHPATSEIKFHGSDKAVYRLRLGAGPWGRQAVPLGWPRSGKASLQIPGWNLPGGKPLMIEPGATPGWKVEVGGDWAEVRGPGIQNVLRLPVGEGDELVEREPNDRAADAQPMKLPGALTGCLQHGEDEDRYRVAARKGESWRWTVQAASLGFPVDAWVRIESTNGTVVARAEGVNGEDPELTWTPGADGLFDVVVGSLVHRGDSNAWYRLAARRLSPDFRVTVGESSWVFQAGSTNDLSVTVTRLNGWTNAVTVRADGLPAGVTAAPVVASEKGGAVSLRVVASAGAAAGSGPFRIVASGAADGERVASMPLVATSENNGVPGGFRELLRPEIETLWWTVKPAPAPKAPAGAAEKPAANAK